MRESTLGRTTTSPFSSLLFLPFPLHAARGILYVTRRSAQPNVETVAGEKNGRLPRITSTATTGVTSSRAKRNGRLSRITSACATISYNDYQAPGPPRLNMSLISS